MTAYHDHIRCAVCRGLLECDRHAVCYACLPDKKFDELIKVKVKLAEKVLEEGENEIL